MQAKKILCALSGGVDSSVSAELLKRQGHEVFGVYMKNWINEDNIVGDCPWREDIESARQAAEKIGIDFEVVNFIEDYRELVVKYILDSYQNNITPNPDVICNRDVKFGLLLDFAKKRGYESVATGHYANKFINADQSQDIYEAEDSNKNQTYFLALLRQEQVRAAEFPIGALPKSEVRKLAKKFGLPNAEKKDSQGICFIGKIKMRDFLRHYIDDNPGEIVDTDGNVLGEHLGLHLYTLGQRRGIGIASNRFKQAYVVVEKNLAKNQLVLAIEEENAPKLFAQNCELSGLSFTNKKITEPTEVYAQPRYRSEFCPAKIFPISDLGKESCVARLEFGEKQRALTPGQICAIYTKFAHNGTEKFKLLGGGVFSRIL